MLKQQHEAFCQNICDGMANGEAYSAAYPKSKSERAAAASATKLLKKADICARIKELQQQVSSERCLSRIRKRELLADIANNSEAKNGDVISAIKTDNEMTGDNAPVKTEEEKTVNVFIQESF